MPYRTNAGFSASTGLSLSSASARCTSLVFQAGLSPSDGRQVAFQAFNRCNPISHRRTPRKADASWALQSRRPGCWPHPPGLRPLVDTPAANPAGTAFTYQGRRAGYANRWPSEASVSFFSFRLRVVRASSTPAAGFVVCVQSYKKDSPSSGLFRVKVFNEHGMAQKTAPVCSPARS